MIILTRVRQRPIFFRIVTHTADLETPRFPVRLVAVRTGLSPHVLRAWERRYGVVAPSRSEGGQRLYSELDVERLRRLRRLTERGHSIGQLAPLSLEQLTRLEAEAAAEPAPSAVPPAGEPAGPEGAESTREIAMAALRATREFAPRELQVLLERAAVTLGVPAFLDQVVAPLLRAIGHGWAVRSVTVAQEHMATAVVRRVLGWILGLYEAGTDAPGIVVATPPGEGHEMGALMVAVSAAAEGWAVTYLGPDLPAEDLLAAVRQTRARAVGISIVNRRENDTAPALLKEIRAGLPDGVALLVGGAAAGELREEAEAIGAEVIGSLAEARAALQRVAGERRRTSPRAGSD
jgi:DNA-binding transcriptional MerR regulator/methylmalonyl-CoA mutase cobalamin-binding subunit